MERGRIDDVGRLCPRLRGGLARVVAVGALVLGLAACGADDGRSSEAARDEVRSSVDAESSTSTEAAPDTTASTSSASSSAPPPTSPPPTTVVVTTAAPTTAPPTTSPPTTASVTTTGSAAEADALMAQWNDLNLRCRGGSGDDAATWEACEQREALYPQIVALGWCYGREGEFGYQEQWHPCGPGSYRG